MMLIELFNSSILIGHPDIIFIVILNSLKQDLTGTISYYPRSMFIRRIKIKTGPQTGSSRKRDIQFKPAFAVIIPDSILADTNRLVRIADSNYTCTASASRPSTRAIWCWSSNGFCELTHAVRVPSACHSASAVSGSM